MRQRQLEPLIVVLLLCSSCLVFAFQPISASIDSWIEKAPMPTAGINFAAVTSNGDIYAIGNDFNYVYNPSADTWSSRAVIPNAEGIYAIASCEGKIYAFGGYNLNSNSSNINDGSTFMYNPTTNQWTAKAQMPTPRSEMQANVAGDKIYIIGGWLKDTNLPYKQGQAGGTIVSNATEAYDSSTNSWTTLAPIPMAVMNYASAVIGSKIYIIGGQNGTADSPNYTQIYDTTTNTWSFGKPLPTLSSPIWMVGMAAAATTGAYAPARVYVIGGFEWGAGSNVTQIYNPTNDTWSTGAQMPTPRADASIAVLNDKLYVMGGTDTWPGGGPFQQPFNFNTTEEYVPSNYNQSPPTLLQSSSTFLIIVAVSVTTAVLIAVAGLLIYFKKKHVGSISR